MSALDSVKLLGWLAFGFITWYLASAVRSWYRLRHIPGPPLASVSHLWLMGRNLRGDTYESYLGLRKYGSLVRVGPNYLVTDNPDELRNIAGAGRKYTRDSWYALGKVASVMDSMISLLDTSEHDALKAKVASGYSGRENSDLEVAIDSQLLRLIDLIKRKHISTGEILRKADFALLSRYFGIDVITRLGYGTAFGYLDEGSDVHGWMSQGDALIATMSLVADVPWIRRVVFSSLGMFLFGPKPTDKRGIGKVMGITKKLIEERLHDGEHWKDMLGSFVRHGLTQQELEANAILQIIAGSDTSAAAIQGTMLYIVSTPRVYSKLKTEIRQAVEEGKVSSPIKYAEALKLPYLQAVIWEGYRLRCPMVYGQFKRVPPGGDTINGHFIPEGTAIGHNVVALTHSKFVFGEDADIFRPERFLECSIEKKSEMDRALDITFGGGRWKCAGQKIAMMELNKIYFELFKAFDFQLIDPVMPLTEKSYIVCRHIDMWMRITEAVE